MKVDIRHRKWYLKQRDKRSNQTIILVESWKYNSNKLKNKGNSEGITKEDNKNQMMNLNKIWNEGLMMMRVVINK